MRPICVHYVSKPVGDGSDEPKRHALCAQYVPSMFRNYCGVKSIGPQCAPYVPTMCPPGANCMSTVSELKWLAPTCAFDAPTMRPLCAHYVRKVKAMGLH